MKHRKRSHKRRGIIILILVIGIGLLVKFFPTIFWKLHGYATKRLQVKLVEGKTDLEYAYGQDLKQEVSELQTEEGYTILYPAEVAEHDELLPVVVWGNGTANTWRNYEPALKSLASYGFVVVGSDDNNMGDGKALYDTALAMRKMSENTESPLCGRLDLQHMGVAGHSQGACGAVNAATKYEESQQLFASVFTTSLPKLSMCVDKDGMEFAYWKYDMSGIRVPYFGNTGTRFLDSMWISPLKEMQENFEALSEDVEAYAARQIGANHNIVNEYHGCGYLNAWFCYTLKGDMTAAQVFTGEDPEILRNTGRWKDVIRQSQER